MKSKCDRKSPGIPGEVLNTPSFVDAPVVVSVLVVDFTELGAAAACLRLVFISFVPSFETVRRSRRHLQDSFVGKFFSVKTRRAYLKMSSNQSKMIWCSTLGLLIPQWASPPSFVAMMCCALRQVSLP